MNRHDLRIKVCLLVHSFYSFTHSAMPVLLAEHRASWWVSQHTHLRRGDRVCAVSIGDYKAGTQMPCSNLCVLGFLTCVRLLSLCVYACVCLCLCVQVCGCVQVHMHVCTHECGGQRSTSAAVAQKEFIFLLGTVFLTRTWSLSSRLGWLTS